MIDTMTALCNANDHCFIKSYLCFLRNIIVVIAVAIIEIIFEIIEGNLKPSGDCRIYPNAINVHTMAGISAMIYGFSVFLR